MKKTTFTLLFALFTLNGICQTYPTAGADEKTPSNSQYFSWINHTNEGPTEEQTLINLDFFEWLHKTYGMTLDIYAFDAGAVDSSMKYGRMDSDRFKELFPRGFQPIVDKAGQMDTRLGLWGGPDGFGDTHKEAKDRMDMMVSLCKDYNFKLFKLDGVCGQLRPGKFEYFDTMMTQCRVYSPDLIMLNHRLELGQGVKHSTTFLLGGDETYIDVHMTNEFTASHHRAKALSRELPPNLTRLTEDHGVCISSCLDYWDDDLILQAFNRNLIMAPQIYGNPWLLRDDEFSQLAYIYNLHRLYNDILVDGMVLPEESYGQSAVSRGSSKTRFITLRNLSWESKKYTIDLNETVGLDKANLVQVRQYHPYIEDLGIKRYGDKIEVEVLPFRALLVKVTTEKERDNILVSGTPYRVVKDVKGSPSEIKLLGEAGSKAKVKITKGGKSRVESVVFSGVPLKDNFHRELSKPVEISMPEDIESIYYSTCFAADNNALEVRSLQRSGSTSIPEVQRARDAFFNQSAFITRDVWDRYMFDGDSKTAFSIGMRWGDQRSGSVGVCLDLGEVQHLDKLVIESFDEYSISPLRIYEGINAFVSKDMKQWQTITFTTGVKMEIDLKDVDAFRYLRFGATPLRISEITGYAGGVEIDRTNWRASNMFRIYGWDGFHARKAWKNEFVLDDFSKGAYLCVAVNGIHGVEGTMVGFKVDGEYVGAPDRAPSFTSNVWEFRNLRGDKNYTYYLPLTEDMKGKNIETYIMAFNSHQSDLEPKVWITSYELPFENKTVIFK